MILVQLFVISLCVTLGFCRIKLITNCSPENENSPEDGNRIKLLEFYLRGCPSDRTTCTLIRGDMLVGRIRARFNYTSTALFMTMKADVNVLHTGSRTLTLADKRNVCGYATQGSSCKKIRPGYNMTFEFSEKMTDWTPSFDGTITTIGTDKDGTIRYCGQAHVIVKGEGKPTVVDTILRPIISR